jgi:nucleotide-binding universal stress UspA family protein
MQILLALDGEPHTTAAVQWALALARRLGLPTTGLHVKDPYLKQFQNEIYAQGREEYLAHVEQCLAAHAREVISGFAAIAEASGVPWEALVLDGDPLELLRQELDSERHTLMVLGRKRLTGMAEWQSRNLPGKLSQGPRRSKTGILIVPADAPPPA